MKRPESAPSVSLEDLIGLRELQEMQDGFSEVAQVTIRTVDASGEPKTSASRLPVLCTEVFRDDKLREKICGQCLPAFLGGDSILDEEFSFECLPGLKNYLIPLKVSMTPTQSLIVGYMILGPLVFMKRKDEVEFKVLAEELGLSDPYQLWSLVLELRVFSHKAIHSLIDMIENLTGHILYLAYAKLMMQRKALKNGPAARMPAKEKFSANSMDEFLGLFLDIVIDITSGNTASVMLFDADKKELTIKAAHGLPPDVVRQASLAPGEGLAGLAAQAKRPFLINADSCDAAISDRLKKPEIFSSAVVPIRFQEDVCGVLNVSSDKAFPVRFDQETLAFLTKAAGLAGAALQRF